MMPDLTTRLRDVTREAFARAGEAGLIRGSRP
jgi:hypothetical protein